MKQRQLQLHVHVATSSTEHMVKHSCLLKRELSQTLSETAIRPKGQNLDIIDPHWAGGAVSSPVCQREHTWSGDDFSNFQITCSHTKMTDYAEEQRNELEAIESIYPDSFTGLIKLLQTEKR